MRGSRRVLLAFVLVLVAAWLAYTAFWVIEAHRIRNAVAALAAPPSDGRPVLTEQNLTVSGYPFTLVLVFSQGFVEGRAGMLDSTRLAIPSLTARARPWQVDRWRVELPQGLAATLPDGGTATIGAVAGKVEIGVNTASPVQGTSATVRLSAHDLAMHGKNGTTSAGSLTAMVVAPLQQPVGHLGAATDITLSAQHIVLPQPVPPLGDQVAKAAIAATVQGPIPTASLALALKAWRDEGGTLEVHSLALDWQGLDIAGNGTLALDGNLQPIGAFSASLSGYGAILDALTASGQLKPEEAHYMKMGLDLLAQKDGDGKRVLKAPVTLQDGGLYIGPARIAKLPAIRW